MSSGANLGFIQLIVTPDIIFRDQILYTPRGDVCVYIEVPLHVRIVETGMNTYDGWGFFIEDVYFLFWIPLAWRHIIADVSPEVMDTLTQL